MEDSTHGAVREGEADPLVGGQLGGRYQIKRLVGRGATGRIYAALDRESRRRVAVKVLHQPLCAVEEEVKRFAREFEATSRIVHPHTVETYGFGEDQGRHYLVMEYLEGRSLAALVEARRVLELAEAMDIARQVASALDAAHSVGVVHRDLNAANVMLVARDGRRDHVKVLDFGIARLRDASESLTGVGVRLGNVHYMAPEYIEHFTVDHRTDLYALGCLLYLMLTGEPPFIGPSMKILGAHVAHPPPAPSAHVAGIPEWADVLVLGLMAKKPENRPGRASDVVEEIRAGIASLSASATAPPRSEPARTVTPTQAGLAHRSHLPAPAGSRASTRFGPRAARIALGLALSILIAGGFVGCLATWLAYLP